MRSDDELIHDIQHGTDSAMEEIVRRYYKTVFAYIYRNVGEYHISYDLTQETFIKMIKNIHSYSASGQFKQWILKIAINTCRDYYKSSGFKQRQNAPIDDAFAEGTPTADVIEEKFENDHIKDALMALPAYQREPIILRFYHDLKIKDIAEITSAGEPTIKSRILQGLSKLKAILEREQQS